jgi:hypothetical protein
MVRDIQVDVAARVRATGVEGDATLRMPPADARRLMAGLQEINTDWNDVHTLDRYPGTGDGQGLIRYALDEALPRGAGLAVDADGNETPVSLDGLTG